MFLTLKPDSDTPCSLSMRSDDYGVSNEEKVVRFVMALCVLKRLVK